MNINQNGFELTNFQDNLNEKFVNLSKYTDKNFGIEAESLITNLLVAIAIMQNSLEKQIAFLLKQFDPETAEGQYQDALYERVALKRINAAPTTFTLVVRGLSESEVLSGTIYIENNVTKDLFFNTEDFEFDEYGMASVTFQSFINDKIYVTPDFSMYEAPDNVFSVVSDTCENIVFGHTEESDAEFRERFHKIKNSNSKCTHNAILKNLSEYTGGLEYIDINDINTNPLLSAGTLEIIARPKVSDAEFCKAILNNTIAGINYTGNTIINVPLSNGQYWTVSYTKAEPVLICISVTVKLKSGYYRNSVFQNVKDNIINYTNSNNYGLGKNVYSSEFISPVIKADGVDGIISIGIKREDAAQYSDTAEINEDEYAIFDSSGITLNIEE